MSAAPWTPGPWRAVQFNAEEFPAWWDIKTMNPSPSDPVAQQANEADARLIAAAPEMAALLAELDGADGFISAIELNRGVNGEDWMERRAALLARVRGEA